MQNKTKTLKFPSFQDLGRVSESGFHLKIHFLFSYQRNKTQDLLDTILSIQPKESSGGGGETREDSVYRQTKEMLAKVPPNFDPHEVKER